MSYFSCRKREGVSHNWRPALGQTPREGERLLSLLVRDSGFVAEVAWMGHGLQMWLQAMWFLARISNDSVVILDEPDVYMHADLQRRLVRLIRGRYRQTIIATHSVEIMAEVEPEQILVVDRRRSSSSFTTSLPAVQRLVERIGGVHNLQLARLWSAKKCLLIEGGDLAILRRIQQTLFPDSEEPLDVVPNMPIGGWGGWNYAVGSSMFLRNAGGGVIKFYCIFDRDYHGKREIAAREEDAKRRNVDLHVWGRKEIENFLLVPKTLHRIITIGIRENKEPPTLENVVDALNRAADSLRHDCTDVIAEELWKGRETSSVKEANRLSREVVSDAWGSLEGRLAIVSGKALLAKMSEWSQKEFGVSLSSAKAAASMRADEIPVEMARVVTAIERGQSFGD
jgi:AAA domain, putative AbiEii toxin, Type IV TA system